MEGNPFHDDIYLGSVGESIGGSSLNEEALARLRGELSAVAGEEAAGSSRVVLLLAPRAGYGKSHLLADFSAESTGAAVVVPIELNLESDVKWGNLLGQLLSILERPRGEAEIGMGRPLSELDHVVRHLLGFASRRLIEEGMIPCAQPDEAIRALRGRSSELFDFSSSDQAVARWFGSNVTRLVPLVAKKLSAASGVSLKGTEQWVRAFCAYAEGGREDDIARGETLRWALREAGRSNGVIGGFSEEAGIESREHGSKERFFELARLVSLYRPLVFVLDHLDSFHGDEDKGKLVAYFLSEMQGKIRREITILSVNEDLWASSFKGGLPSAFEDRLTGNIVNLRGLDPVGGERLVRERLGVAGATADEENAFCEFLRLKEYFGGEQGRMVSPRAVLRYASVHWEMFRNRGETDGTNRWDDDEGGGDGGGSEDFFPPVPGASKEENGPGETSSYVAPIEPFLIAPDDGDEAMRTSVLGADVSGAIADAVGGFELTGEEGRQDSLRKDDSQGGKQEDVGGEDPKAFQRLKAMLLQLREQRTGEEVETQGVTRTGSVEEVLKAPVISRDSGSDTVLAAFQKVRERWEREVAAGNGELRTERLRSLVTVAGNRFPVVHYSEFRLEAEAGKDVAKWAFRGSEVYFGFEPRTNESYWTALAEFVANRSRLHRGAISEQGGFRAKLIAFSLADEGEPYLSLRNGDTPWDVIRLDRSALTSLYAADEMLSKAGTAELEASPGEVLGLLANELDFFWKRITRPLVEGA